MKRKSDKVLILILIIIGVALLSWMMPQGSFNYGVYEASEKVRAGIFDVFVDFFLAIYYNYTDILYILMIGGCYGVLSKTKSYRKLVDKTAKLIKGKEAIAMAVSTLVVSLVTSFTSQVMIMFAVVPFIASVFLRNGFDKLTALNASFGGILVGFIGLTFGTYSIDYLIDITQLSIKSLMVLKFVIYIVALVLYNVFAIMYMKKHQNVDDQDEDLFLPEELNESKVKTSKRTKIWPIITVFAITLVLIIIGYITWEMSFNISFFSDVHSKFSEAAKIADVPIFSSIIGSQMKAFGDWDNLIVGSFLMFVATVIVSLIDKMKFNDFVLRFDVGIKKVLRTVIIFSLVQTVYVMSRNFPWIDTVVNSLFGSGNFNIFTMIIISIIATFVTVHPGYGNYIYGAVFVTMFSDKLAETALLWHIGQGFVFLLAPTSVVLFMALTYFDIPYKEWLKNIWKYALSLFIAVLLIMVVKIYM